MPEIPVHEHWQGLDLSMNENFEVLSTYFCCCFDI
jgi:hypothetical protein